MTDTYKEGIHDFFKTSPTTKAFYDDVFKKMITFIDYFPAIQFFYIDSGKIYILTYLEENEKYETFIYGIDGKFIKRVFLPYKFKNALERNPETFFNNKFYRLIENEETEEWELHATKIE